ncbi:MAG: hypothetical protein Q8Q60_05135 [Candidatus Chromulinivorax sp.]|nr:hypothetical protein [Candidatus Chromulinivorax sp.]
MKILSVILFVVVICSGSMYGSTKSMYGSINAPRYLVKTDSQGNLRYVVINNNVSYEQLRTHQRALLAQMFIFNGDESNSQLHDNQIFSPRGSDEVIEAQHNSSTDIQDINQQNSTPTITQASSPVVICERKRATCMSCFKQLCKLQNKVYIDSENN